MVFFINNFDWGDFFKQVSIWMSIHMGPQKKMNSHDVQDPIK
jgi:hypothetical protein